MLTQVVEHCMTTLNPEGACKTYLLRQCLQYGDEFCEFCTSTYLNATIDAKCNDNHQRLLQMQKTLSKNSQTTHFDIRLLSYTPTETNVLSILCNLRKQY